MAKSIRIKLAGDYLVVKFDYDRELVSRMHDLRDTVFGAEKDAMASFHRPTSSWLVSPRIGHRLVSMFEDDCHVLITRDAFTVCEAPPDVKAQVPEGFEFKTDPMPHQIATFNAAMNGLDCFHMGDDQGLGKTKQLIDIADARKHMGLIDHCLVIVAVNGIKYNWMEQIEEHSFNDAVFLGQRTSKRGRTRIGTTGDKLWDCWNVPDEFYLVVNVEALREKEVRRAMRTQTRNGTFGMACIDEIHKCKNPTSEQGMGLLKVEPQFRVSMSGTPLVNSPLDLYMPIKWLGWEKNNWTSFKYHHCKYEGETKGQITGFKNMPQLQKRFERIQIRRLKSEVLDLPEKTRSTEWVELSKGQRKLYNEVLQETIVEYQEQLVDRVKLNVNPLALLTRLFQAATTPSILTTASIASAKYIRVVDMIEEQIAEGNSVGVYATQVGMLEPFVQMCTEDMGWDAKMIHGGILPVEKRQVIKREFQAGEFPILAGTIGAMGTGLDIKKASAVYFLDEPWTPTDKLQAEDRFHRIGITGTVNIVTVLAKDTADEKKHLVLKHKEKYAGALVDGNKEDMRWVVGDILGLND